MKFTYSELTYEDQNGIIMAAKIQWLLRIEYCQHVCFESAMYSVVRNRLLSARNETYLSADLHYFS